MIVDERAGDAEIRGSDLAGLRLRFDRPPAASTRDRLRGRFVWDPTDGVWIAPMTPENLALARELALAEEHPDPAAEYEGWSWGEFDPPW